MKKVYALCIHLLVLKWARLDSNQRPKDYESSALPLRHKPMAFIIQFVSACGSVPLPTSLKT